MAKHAPRDEGLIEIDRWEEWFLKAQIDTLIAKRLGTDELRRELAAARTLTASIAERMRSDYLHWKKRLESAA